MLFVYFRSRKNGIKEDKYYSDGKILGTFKPDGSYTIFYQNENPAIKVLQTEDGK